MVYPDTFCDTIPAMEEILYTNSIEEAGEFTAAEQRTAGGIADPAEPAEQSEYTELTGDAAHTERTEQPAKRRRRRKPAAVTAYLDTEFNAFDYFGQNGGNQEILQIGAVIMKGGKQIDAFQTFCALRKGHLISRRTVKLTGITKADLKDAPEFPEALEMLNDFLDQYAPKAIYAYGDEDRVQMLNTARLNGVRKESLRYVEKIENILKRLSTQLGLKKRSNLTLSVNDLCKICEVSAEHQHDALNDAVYLALCSELILRGAFSRENVQKLIDRKSWMSNYRISRRIKDRRETVILEDSDLAPIKAVISTLQEDGLYPDYQLQAIYDDLLMITGREPETGKH